MSGTNGEKCCTPNGIHDGHHHHHKSLETRDETTTELLNGTNGINGFKHSHEDEIDGLASVIDAKLSFLNGGHNKVMKEEIASNHVNGTNGSLEIPEDMTGSLAAIAQTKFSILKGELISLWSDGTATYQINGSKESVDEREEEDTECCPTNETLTNGDIIVPTTGVFMNGERGSSPCENDQEISVAVAHLECPHFDKEVAVISTNGTSMNKNLNNDGDYSKSVEDTMDRLLNSVEMQDYLHSGKIVNGNSRCLVSAKIEDNINQHTVQVYDESEIPSMAAVNPLDEATLNGINVNGLDKPSGLQECQLNDSISKEDIKQQKPNGDQTGLNCEFITSEQVHGVVDQSSSHTEHEDQNLKEADVELCLLKGELINFKGETVDGILILTNYRVLYAKIKSTNGQISLPLGVIESAEAKDLSLHIHTKLVRNLVVTFNAADDCFNWSTKINEALSRQSKLEDLFCFKLYKAYSSSRSDSNVKLSCETPQCNYITPELVHMEDVVLYREFKRMNFCTKWKISTVNKDFKLCPSYPRYLIVPENVSDSDLEIVASFRYSRRIPAVVWRSRKNGCVIARSSQPEVGWLGWRNNHDENLIKAIASSCISDVTTEDAIKKLLILDARSYAAAVANRAKGGGCECSEYYPGCDVQFMSLANIHTIRKSFQSLRSICEASSDQSNWLSLLDGTRWLEHISSLINCSSLVVNTVEDEVRPVLVHCSDGWDRTPQIVALAEIMLDPYYRTIDGFKDLVEKEWLEFGHKFSDRCGYASTADENERCPVFLQWLDCVHQLVKQTPLSFQFNVQYLEMLAFHTYSCLFSTFIGNNTNDRCSRCVYEKSYSLWSYIEGSRHKFINDLYSATDEILRPSSKVKDMLFWGDVYAPVASGNSNLVEDI